MVMSGMLVEKVQYGKGRSLSQAGGRKTMHILLYGNHGSSDADRIEKAIQGLVPRKRVRKFPSLESLSKGLRRPQTTRAIAVLVPLDHQDLLSLLPISDLLYDIPLIMVLPDRDMTTISIGHTFRPRFLTFADSDFADVAAVLEKMLKNAAQSGEGTREVRGGARV
jgi:hypothetical protein